MEPECTRYFVVVNHTIGKLSIKKKISHSKKLFLLLHQRQKLKLSFSQIALIVIEWSIIESCSLSNCYRLVVFERCRKEIYDLASQSNQMENCVRLLPSSGPFTHPIQIGKLDTLGFEEAVKRTFL